MGQGRLITLEGVEGAGKSSQIPVIESLLRAQGIPVVVTREPGGTPLAESIRHILVEGDDMPAMTELLLMFAARSSHVAEKILPALQAGQWVVCDRFVDASFAYQGAGRGIATEHVQALARMTLGELQPDHVLLFDLPVQDGLARVASRGEKNRFDDAGIEFMQKVRECYLQRAAADETRYSVIDAGLDFAAVSDQVTQQIREILATS